MSISPESIKGQVTRAPGEHVMLMKQEDAREALLERIKGVVEGVELHAELFVMTRDEFSTVTETAGSRRTLKKGRLQTIALNAMSEFGFDPRISQIEETSRTCEVKNYPSATNEGLIFRRVMEMNKRQNPISVKWSVHKSTPTNSS